MPLGDICDPFPAPSQSIPVLLHKERSEYYDDPAHVTWVDTKAEGVRRKIQTTQAVPGPSMSMPASVTVSPSAPPQNRSEPRLHPLRRTPAFSGTSESTLPPLLQDPAYFEKQIRAVEAKMQSSEANHPTKKANRLKKTRQGSSSARSGARPSKSHHIGRHTHSASTSTTTTRASSPRGTVNVKSHRPLSTHATRSAGSSRSTTELDSLTGVERENSMDIDTAVPAQSTAHISGANATLLLPGPSGTRPSTENADLSRPSNSVRSQSLSGTDTRSHPSAQSEHTKSVGQSTMSGTTRATCGSSSVPFQDDTPDLPTKVSRWMTSREDTMEIDDPHLALSSQPASSPLDYKCAGDKGAPLKPVYGPPPRSSREVEPRPPSGGSQRTGDTCRKEVQVNGRHASAAFRSATASDGRQTSLEKNAFGVACGSHRLPARDEEDDDDDVEAVEHELTEGEYVEDDDTEATDTEEHATYHDNYPDQSIPGLRMHKQHMQRRGESGDEPDSSDSDDAPLSHRPRPSSKSTQSSRSRKVAPPTIAAAPSLSSTTTGTRLSPYQRHLTSDIHGSHPALAPPQPAYSATYSRHFQPSAYDSQHGAPAQPSSDTAPSQRPQPSAYASQHPTQRKSLGVRNAHTGRAAKPFKVPSHTGSTQCKTRDDVYASASVSTSAVSSRSTSTSSVNGSRGGVRSSVEASQCETPATDVDFDEIGLDIPLTEEVVKLLDNC